MRFVLYGLFLALWCVMWWWTYTCHIKVACCPEGMIAQAVPPVKIDPDDPRPYAFSWGNATPLTSDAFIAYRDSLSSVIREGQIYGITGQYYRDEQPLDTVRDLGLERARHLRDLLLPQIDSQRMRVSSAVIPLTGNVRDSLFQPVQMQRMWRTETIMEYADSVIIYPGRTDTLDNTVQQYLDELAEEIQAEETTGVTIVRGDDQQALRIRDALIERGVDASIITSGEPAGAEGETRGQGRVILRIHHQN